MDGAAAVAFCGIADRHDALAAPFALQPDHDLVAVELEFAERDRGGFADAHAGVDEQQEEGLVARRLPP